VVKERELIKVGVDAKVLRKQDKVKRNNHGRVCEEPKTEHEKQSRHTLPPAYFLKEKVWHIILDA